jgi:hypothetical protein
MLVYASGSRPDRRRNSSALTENGERRRREGRDADPWCCPVPLRKAASVLPGSQRVARCGHAIDTGAGWAGPARTRRAGGRVPSALAHNSCSASIHSDCAREMRVGTDRGLGWRSSGRARGGSVRRTPLPRRRVGVRPARRARPTARRTPPRRGGECSGDVGEPRRCGVLPQGVRTPGGRTTNSDCGALAVDPIDRASLAGGNDDQACLTWFGYPRPLPRLREGVPVSRGGWWSKKSRTPTSPRDPLPAGGWSTPTSRSAPV